MDRQKGGWMDEHLYKQNCVRVTHMAARRSLPPPAVTVSQLSQVCVAVYCVISHTSL